MNYQSTRGIAPLVTFAEAFKNGLAPDGGLYVPEAIPRIMPDLLIDDALPYPALAWDMLTLFDTDTDPELLMEVVEKSYGDFTDLGIAPLQQLGPNLFVLELFHGPTLSFKDFALQLVGNLFEEQIKRTGETINVLGATSGDTGSAAIHGLAGKEGVNVFILYPEGRISELQERQMTCTEADNVFPIPIKGTFDDAQAIVKELMGDLEFKETAKLSAINSINLARILAQTVYYLHAFMQLPPDNRDDVHFVVPTGNFGNVFAGWLASKIGMPVEKFIVATNQNDILYRFFNSGEYSPEDVFPSLAPSMDIQMASNFERLLFYLNKEDSDKTLGQMASLLGGDSLTVENFDEFDFAASKCSDDEIIERIKKVYDEFQYIVDPHTACAMDDLYPDQTRVVLATASPAKFPDVIEKAIGERPTDPSLERLKKKTPATYPCEANAAAVRAFIEANLA